MPNPNIWRGMSEETRNAFEEAFALINPHWIPAQPTFEKELADELNYKTGMDILGNSFTELEVQRILDPFPGTKFVLKENKLDKVLAFICSPEFIVTTIGILLLVGTVVGSLLTA